MPANSEHGLIIHADLFALLLKELSHRGGGIRESGAFLLGAADDDPVRDPINDRVEVIALAFYDDLDPDCLTGGITFSADGYSALAKICRRDGVRVVGDIHTHPADWVGQSPTDANHPMSALSGHLALIAPRFAQDDLTTNDLGAHRYGGTGTWMSYYGSDVDAVLRVTGGITSRWIPRWLCHLGSWLRRLLTSRRLR
jgi:hypothetical protein